MKLYLIESSEEELKKIRDAGNMQRGTPELVMVETQRLLGGGVMSFCLEHVGDIYHRMTHMVPSVFMIDEVYGKSKKCYNVLTQGYGFGKEFQENLRNNAEYRDIDYSLLVKQVDAMLDQYADAHSRLPVYNRMMKTARSASVALGLKHYETCAGLLKNIMDIIDADVEKYKQIVMSYDDSLT